MSGHRILVCGGRDYADHTRIYSVLSYYHRQVGFAVIIHGAARGADSFAGEWAEWADVPQLSFPVTPAEWAFKGKREGRPDVVIAFPGQRGTANMCEQAERAGVSVLRIPA